MGMCSVLLDDMDDREGAKTVPKQSIMELLTSSFDKDPDWRPSAILIGATSLRKQMGQPLDIPAFFKLYGCVLACARKAIRDDVRSGADETIMTILALMTFEAYYGCWQRYQVHKQGLTALLARRGASTGSTIQSMVRVVLSECAAPDETRLLIYDQAPNDNTLEAG